MLKPFLGIEQLLRMGESIDSSSSSYFMLQTSMSGSESDWSEMESESESDSGAVEEAGMEEQLTVRLSVRLSSSLGLTLEWQVLRCERREEGEVQGAGQRGQPLE